MTTTAPPKEIRAACDSSRNDTVFALVRPLLERSARSLGAGLIAAVVAALETSRMGAQTVELSGADLANPASLAMSMPRMAARAIDVYREHDRRDSLDNVFRLELVAGRYDDAVRSIAALHLIRTGAASAKVTVQNRATNTQYGTYVRAKLLRPDALGVAFRETFARPDDRTSALVVREFIQDTVSMQGALQRRTAGLDGKAQLPVDTAVALIRDYQMVQTYRELAPFARSLVVTDDARRYVINRDIHVRSADGAIVCVMVVRQRSASWQRDTRTPALLNFTIYADPVTTMNEARRTASNGYAGVERFTRGKACSPDIPVPYEHDGDDADAVINWISKQSWSDGRVGMYGGSYEGFAQWAAAKHLPDALKAMMPSVSAAPGIDVPMEGNVFQTFVYYWPFYTEISGLFSGRLDVITNKRDFDFNVSLYELTPTGEYVALSFYMARASYVRDRSRRQLLLPSRPEQLEFTSGRMTSRKFQAGSRLIAQVSIIRQPGAQINYGTAGNVSDETIADADDPLVIRWLGTSAIDVPVWRQ